MTSAFAGFSKGKWLSLAVLVAVVLFVQFFRIDRPYIGYFSSYQSGMASVARNIVRENFSEIFLPKTDALIFQPKRALHLNAFLSPAIIAAVGVKYLGGTYEFWGRFQAIAFNLLTIFLLLLIAAKMFGPDVGIVSAFVFGLSPYTLIYGQAFMSEALTVFSLMASLGAIVGADSIKKMGHVVLSAFFFSIALLNRIHFVVFLPGFIYLLCPVREERQDALRKILVFIAISLSLPTLWYGFTFFAPRYYDNVHTTLFMQLGSTSTAKAFFELDYLKKVLWTVCFRIFTPVLVPFFVFGLFLLPRVRNGIFLLLNIAAGFALVFLFPQKIFDHDFYLYGVFPFAAILVAYALVRFFNNMGKHRQLLCVLGLVIYLAVSIRLFIHPLYSASKEDQESVRISKVIKPMLAESDLLITEKQCPPAFSYYVDRPLWTIDLSTEEKKAAGYLKSRYAPKAYLSEVSRFELAIQNPITWYEYLKSKGATKAVFLDKRILERNHGFFQYLKAHADQLSKDSDSFYLFGIKS